MKKNEEKRRHVFGLKRGGLSYYQIAKILKTYPANVSALLRPPPEIRAIIIERSKNRCEICHKPTRHGDMHHESYNMIYEDFNKSENLEYLCPKCHQMKHCGYSKDFTKEVM
jgi:hypothetical protein